MRVALFLCFLGAALIGQSFRYSTYLGTAALLTADAKGYVYAAGRIDGGVFVARLDPEGHVAYRVTIKDEQALVSGIAADAAGNAYVVGQTFSKAFPVRNALQPNRPDNGFGQSFAAKLDPNGAVIWATYIGGMGGENQVKAIASDAAGNVYLTGNTNAPDFPVTPGAFQGTLGTSQSRFLDGSTAFVAKLSSAGDKFLYATYLGGRTAPSCTQPRNCHDRNESGIAIAVDVQGNAYVTGYSTATDFPVTAGAFQTDCHCVDGSAGTFVTKLNASGTALLYSTLSISGTAIAVDEAGAVYVAGSMESSGLPITPGAYQNRLIGSRNLFVTKLNPLGTGLTYSTYLGGSGVDNLSGFAVDSQGNAWVSGGTDSADYPETVGVFKQGGAFMTKLNAQGSGLLVSLRLPGGLSGGLALDGKGGAYLGASYVSHLDLLDSSTPSIVEVINAAYSNMAMKTGVAQHISPGEWVSILGFRIGPTGPAGAQLDSNGRVALAIAGVRVFFDEIPAPLLFVQRDQINAVAPFGIAGRQSVKIRVELNEVPSPAIDIAVADTEPEIFLNRDFSAAALNEDGTLNTRDNPAKPGSIVVTYATGLGRTAPPSLDGQLAIQPYPEPVTPPQVSWDGGPPAEITYLGAAPGMVAGVFQINARLPPGPSKGYRQMWLTMGNAFTAGPLVYETPSFPFAQ